MKSVIEKQREEESELQTRLSLLRGPEAASVVSPKTLSARSTLLKETESLLAEAISIQANNELLQSEINALSRGNSNDATRLTIIHRETGKRESLLSELKAKAERVEVKASTLLGSLGFSI